MEREPSIIQEQIESRLLQIPTPEDWVTMQGGKPLVYFRPPSVPRSKGIFFVMHVYGEPFYKSKSRPSHYGLIVPTPYDQMLHSLNYPDTYEVPSAESGTSKIIKVPSAMLASRHGLPCIERSQLASSQDQEQGLFVKNLNDYLAKIDDWKSQKYTEFRLGVNANGGFSLRPK